MSKRGEIDYLKKLGPEGQAHALDKPYSDEKCGHYLSDVGTIMNLLPQPPARILDLGVGSGWSSVFYAKRGYEVIGQDISPDMIDLANRNRDRAGLRNLDFMVSDYEDLPFRSQFDAAVFYDCLHHCLDAKKAISSAFHSLKPGGLMIAVEPGAGHGDSDLAKEVVAKFDVTERDMPPRLIIDIGLRVGFVSYRVYQRHFDPVELKDFRWSSPNAYKKAFRKIVGNVRVDLDSTQIVAMQK